MTSKRICCLINAGLSEMLLEGLSAFRGELGRLRDIYRQMECDIEDTP